MGLKVKAHTLDSELNRYFEYENVQYSNIVRFTITKLKGYPALCCNVVQNGRVDKLQEKIKNWKKMVSKIKDKLFLVDYEQSLCRENKKFE